MMTKPTLAHDAMMFDRFDSTPHRASVASTGYLPGLQPSPRTFTDRILFVLYHVSGPCYDKL
jgi:hypothetical protein